MFSSFKFQSCLVALAVSLAGAPAALAQGAPSDAAPAGASDQPAIGDIVVTAQRREQRLQDVPASVVAFNQQALTQRAVANAYDVAKIAPGLSVVGDTGNPSLPLFSIRGRGFTYGAASGSVETYFAEVPLSGPFEIPTLPAQFFDIGSFQVLKGPQGTLFGRSTTGGAVVIVPQAPTDRFEGYARLQGGNYGNFQAEGAVNLPLGDKFALRLAGFDWQRQGYMYSPAGITDPLTGQVLPSQRFNNVDTTELRGTLLAKPFDGFENSLIVTYHHDRTAGSPGAGLNRIGLGTPNGRGAFYSPGYGTYVAPIDTNLARPGTDVWAVINTSTLQLGHGLKLKNIFGYINAKGFTNDGQDGDGTSVPGIAVNIYAPARPKRNKQYTDELQLQGSTPGDGLTWVIGGLLDKTREPGDPNTINPYIYSWQFGGPAFYIFENNKYDSYALYASATAKLGDRLTVTGGIRHSWDDISVLHVRQVGTSPVANLAGAIADRQKFEGTNGNVQVSYRASDGVMVYAGYRHGYKRGGVNVGIQDPALHEFGPESIDDFSIGAKTDFTLGAMPVRLNIEGYYDRYKNMQATYFAFVGSGTAAVTTNIPRSRYLGLDLDLTAKPTPWLDLSANYSLIDAKNTVWADTTVPGQTQDLTANPIPFAAKNSFSGTARVHGEVGNAGELAFAVSVSHQDKLYTSPTARILPFATQALVGPYNMDAAGGAQIPGYTLVDLRAEWNHVLGSRLNAAVNVTNLTNKLYFLANSATLHFAAEADAYAPPRMVSFEISTKF